MIPHMTRIRIWKRPNLAFSMVSVTLTATLFPLLHFFSSASRRPQLQSASACSLARPLGDLDHTIVGIDLHPVAGFDDEQRILLQLGHGGRTGDDGAERHLGCHLVEDHRARRYAVE